MKHYLMLPQDTIRVLLPEDGQEACVELFCERVAIYFPVETLTVMHFTGVLVDKAREDALGLCGPDALFGSFQSKKTIMPGEGLTELSAHCPWLRNHYQTDSHAGFDGSTGGPRRLSTDSC